MRIIKNTQNKTVVTALIGVSVGLTINNILSPILLLIVNPRGAETRFLNGALLDFLALGVALFLLNQFTLLNKKGIVLIAIFFSLASAFPIFTSLGAAKIIRGESLNPILFYSVLRENTLFLVGHWFSNLIAVFIWMAIFTRYPFRIISVDFNHVSGLPLVLMGSSVAFSVAYLLLIKDPLVIWGYDPQEMSINYASFLYGSVITIVALGVSVKLISILIRKPLLKEAIIFSFLFRIIASLTPTITIIKEYLENIFPVSVTLKQITFHTLFVGINLVLGFLVVWVTLLFINKSKTGYNLGN